MTIKGGIGNLLPDSVRQYSRSPSFNRDSVPTALTENHRTKPGVWGRINVETGALTYTIAGSPDRSFQLSPEEPGIIAPEEAHKVALATPDTIFHVAFFRQEQS